MSSTSGYATLGTPVAFFASFAHTPRADSWFLASHSSHAAADSNGSSGISAVMAKVLQAADGAVGDADAGQASLRREHDAKGLLAGFCGTAAMTLSSTLEEKLRGREPSTAPADAAAKVLGIRAFESDAAKSRFSNAVHWSYGTAWGAVRALLGERLSPVAASAAPLAALWGSEQ